MSKSSDQQAATSNQSAIRCAGLSKRYGEIEALKPLDLSVPQGAIFGFLGRNGAGKTTTIRLLTGLAHPTTGQAWVNGIAATNGDSMAQTQFGYLPQDPAFYTWMTAVSYLDYMAKIYGLNGAVRNQRIAEMLDLVGLTAAAKRKIGGFSGGMKQRLGIAQALIHEPPVLFLDEPTSALDPAGRYEVLDMINSLRGQVTVFLSSHILGDVERVCDTVGIIHEGELLLVADRDELLARHATNVLVLELDRAFVPPPDAFVTALQEQTWVTAVTVTNHHLHVVVTETAVAKQAIFPLIAQFGLALNKYEWQRPSLEEIFLSISSAH